MRGNITYVDLLVNKQCKPAPLSVAWVHACLRPRRSYKDEKKMPFWCCRLAGLVGEGTKCNSGGGIWLIFVACKSGEIWARSMAARSAVWRTARALPMISEACHERKISILPKLRSHYAYQGQKSEVPNKHIKYAYWRGRTVPVWNPCVPAHTVDLDLIHAYM